jgi:hypothetical protein
MVKQLIEFDRNGDSTCLEEGLSRAIVSEFDREGLDKSVITSMLEVKTKSRKPKQFQNMNINKYGMMYGGYNGYNAYGQQQQMQPTVMMAQPAVNQLQVQSQQRIVPNAPVVQNSYGMQ